MANFSDDDYEDLIIAEDFDESEDDDDKYERGEVSEIPIFNIGYGKADVPATELVVTGKNVFVPNSITFADADGKTQKAGYFSFSALGTYRRCQKAYYFKYVEKVRKPEPAIKMWAGSGMHTVIEEILEAKMAQSGVSVSGEASHEAVMRAIGGENVIPTNEHSKMRFEEEFNDFQNSYLKRKASYAREGITIPDVVFPKSAATQEQFLLLFKNAVDAYMKWEFPHVKPVSIEDIMVHQFDLKSGGTVPIVGFLDLIETTNNIGEYYDRVTNENYSDPHTAAKGKHSAYIETGAQQDYVKKLLKSIDEGELMITDHKCGMPKSWESARTNQQLTLYSMAKGIPLVAFDSVATGTSGGKNPSRAKPARVNKFMSRRTDQDYDRLHDDFNSIIEGISSGNYDRSGADNMMVCSPTLCAFYDKCLGKSSTN